MKRPVVERLGGSLSGAGGLTPLFTVKQVRIEVAKLADHCFAVEHPWAILPRGNAHPRPSLWVRDHLGGDWVGVQ